MAAVVWSVRNNVLGRKQAPYNELERTAQNRDMLLKRRIKPRMDGRLRSLAVLVPLFICTLPLPAQSQTTFTVTQGPAGATGPMIQPGGIVPVDSTAPTIQPGELVSIWGTNLASSAVIWNGDFPTSLGGTSVTINGKAAYH